MTDFIPADLVKHDRSSAQIAKDRKDVEAWLKKNKPTVLPPATATWAIEMLIPYANMPLKGKRGRPAKQ